jgi:signal peptidase I
MMRWWKNRQILKQSRELVAAARKLVRIHRDVLEPAKVQAVSSASSVLASQIKARDIDGVQTARDRLEKLLDQVFPRPPQAGLRENVEVLLVAVIVAMGVRTFFVQPFKIPTGSMQPTLYGVFPQENQPPLLYSERRPSVPEKIFGIALLGRIYEDIGYRTRGDHIFVDKISYHFRKPERGEVIVFETTDIPDIPASSRGKFYIKRLVALGGDTVQVNPPYALVNGKILDGRPAFKRIYSRQNGYSGYIIPESYPPPKYIRSRDDVYQVPSEGLFVLGDNSSSSLDGRFWGAVPSRSLVGRAFMVYWPFSRRFGQID